MRHLFIISLLILGSACDDGQQDLSTNLYTVQELISSQECRSNCGESSTCEGRNIELTGILRKPTKLVPWIHLEEIFDGNQFTVEIRLASEIDEALLLYLDTLYDKEVTVSSSLQGEDRAINFDCLHLFFLALSSSDQIQEK